MVPTLSRAYSCHYSLIQVWALHFKLTIQVCFLSPRIHQTKDAPDKDENDLLSWSLHNSSADQPVCCEGSWVPFIAPCE
jgi:hypothetical protein